MQKIVNNNFKFVVCLDSSSNDYSEHEFLKSNNIDVLVIDHHNAEKVSEYACVINNQLCNYPTKSLCGGAMTYKFCCYLDLLIKTSYAINYEDLAAISLIGDMMELKDFETHYLVKDGIQRITNEFFKAMIERQSYKLENNLTPIGIAFYIVPYINAMTRSGTQEEKMLIFEAMLEWKGKESLPSTKRGHKGEYETRIEQAVRTCFNVKNRQKNNQDLSLQNIENIIQDLNLLDNKILVVPTEQEDVDKNLAGLIANQLASRYMRPALVLRRIDHYDEENNSYYITYEGSGRNYGKSKLDNLRQFCLDTGLVLYAEGHNNAFGLGISAENLEPFTEKTNELLKDFDTTPCYLVDLEVPADQLTSQEVFEIASNNDIWGQGLDEPLIAITNIRITNNNLRFMGEKQNTVKFNLPGSNIPIIKFNLTDEEKDSLSPNGGVITLNVIGKCNLNFYMGNVSAQILLEDFEVLRQTKWDF